MLLVLQLPDPAGPLNEFLPNDTEVWRHWKTARLERLRDPDDQSFQFGGKVGDLNGATQQEKVLFELPTNMLRQRTMITETISGSIRCDCLEQWLR